MDGRQPTLAEVERLFRSGSLSRRQFLAALAGMGLTASALSALVGTDVPIARSENAVARYLVLIVLDGFRPDYMSLAPMPALHALMKEGVTYDQAWVAQLESYTPTSHATLSTGAVPRHHSIIGFEWRDPVTDVEVYDAWAKEALVGKLERDLKASGTTSIPATIKAADPAATVVALSSEKIHAADAMGGPAADYILYHGLPRTKPLVLTPAAIPGHTPPPEFFHHPQLWEPLPLKHFTDWDYLSGQLALTAFDAFRPRALMINLPGADIYGHLFAGPASPTVMAKVAAGLDRNIARVVQAYKSAGIYEQTLFVVAADHGMVPNYRTTETGILKSAVRRAGGNNLFHTGGTAAYVYLRNPSAARAVSHALLDLPTVAAAYYHHHHGGQHEYLPAPGMSLSPVLDEAYRYLLSTFEGPSAPDVVAPYHENTVGSERTQAYGDHGGLNWGVQHVPLVLRGPGLKEGHRSHYPARLVDVAPTVLRLLGLSAPMDGAVLADALLDPTAAEVAGQAALSPSTLTAYQNALIERSMRDIRWYQKNRIENPPPGRLHP